MDLANKPLLDFAWANKRLAWQRQVAYIAGTILAALTQNVMLALFCYCICMVVEINEIRLCEKVLETKSRDADTAEGFRAKLALSGILGSSAIVFFVIVMAIAEGSSIHIGPLFFLMMASLYTAINNCQLPVVMTSRLLIFSVGFFFVPLYDLIIIWPQQRTDLWTQFGTSMFVLLFVMECARKFTSHYQAVQTKMEDLRVERDRLAEAFEVQSQFVSIVSHELRTPLTSVKASLDLIADEKACKTLDDVRRIARIGQPNGTRLAALIDDLLDFQKLDATAMEIQLRCVDLRDLVQESEQANRILGTPREIGFTIRLPERPLYVMGDRNRLLQVMANVLSNAVKFSHEGGTVEIVAEQDGTKGRVSVHDHGIGIPEGSHDLVFAPFAQVDGSDNRTYGGTGLGLSISERILRRHDGTIDFVSTVGEGTVFTIELELCPPPAAEDVEAEEPCVSRRIFTRPISKLLEMPQQAR